MKNLLFYSPESSIYPGNYVPVISKDQIWKEMKESHEGDFQIPPVNITEHADSYHIQVAIPGVQREHFLIQSIDNVLTICVLQKSSTEENVQGYHLHEFNYTCFSRHVVLPENVDTSYVYAEYNGGILSIHVSKSKLRSTGNSYSHIVVY